MGPGHSVRQKAATSGSVTLSDQRLAEGVVGQDAGELDDRPGLRRRQQRQEGMAEVVLHLGAAEARPEVLEQLHELGGDELRLVRGRALEEVEAARVVPIGEPQDVDAGRRARRQPLEDVGRQIAVGIDDRRPDRRLRERKDEVEQERALAGSGRAEDREMAGEGVRGQGERAAAALAEHEPEAPVLARWRGTERTGAGKAGAVERSVGQVPQLRELPVREPGGRRCPAGATPDLPADRLPAVVELGGEVRRDATGAPLRRRR